MESGNYYNTFSDCVGYTDCYPACVSAYKVYSFVCAGSLMIAGQRIYDELDLSRGACIIGSLSGGKSRLAFDLAIPYWREGYRVVSNVPHNFGETLGAFGWEGLSTLAKCFVIFDEGGEYVRSQKLATALTRSQGKADWYGIFAGRKLPHKILQEIVIEPAFDFYLNYGLPFILWRVIIYGAKKIKFNFFQYGFSKVHGIYSTISSSAAIDNLSALAKSTVDKLAEAEGHQAGEASEAGIFGFADDMASIEPQER